MAGKKEKFDFNKTSCFYYPSKVCTQKFSYIVNLVLSMILKLFYSYEGNVSIAAIDATGFTSSYASYYYSGRKGNFEEAS